MQDGPQDVPKQEELGPKEDGLEDGPKGLLKSLLVQQEIPISPPISLPVSPPASPPPPPLPEVDGQWKAEPAPLPPRALPKLLSESDKQLDEYLIKSGVIKWWNSLSHEERLERLKSDEEEKRSEHKMSPSSAMLLSGKLVRKASMAKKQVEEKRVERSSTPAGVRSHVVPIRKPRSLSTADDSIREKRFDRFGSDERKMSPSSVMLLSGKLKDRASRAKGRVEERVMRSSTPGGMQRSYPLPIIRRQRSSSTADYHTPPESPPSSASTSPSPSPSPSSHYFNFSPVSSSFSSPPSSHCSPPEDPPHFSLDDEQVSRELSGEGEGDNTDLGVEDPPVPPTPLPSPKMKMR